MGKGALARLASAALALCLAGCSAPAAEDRGAAGPPARPSEGPVAESAPEGASVVESGWCGAGGTASGPSYYLYSAVLENPSDSADLRDAVLVIEGRDAAGDVVFSQEEPVPLIAAGDRFACGGRAGGGAQAASLELSVSGGAAAEPSAPKSSELYAVEEVVENGSGPGPSSYTGTLRALAPAPEGFGRAKASVLLRDAAGGLTAGYSAVVEAGGVGEAVPFEVPAPGMPQHSSYEVAAVPWP